MAAATYSLQRSLQCWHRQRPGQFVDHPQAFLPGLLGDRRGLDHVLDALSGAMDAAPALPDPALAPSGWYRLWRYTVLIYF